MIVMPSNNSGLQVGYLAGKYPGKIGWLISPEGWRCPPSWMPYALDNGAYGAWDKQRPWDADKFLLLLDQAKHSSSPRWVVVPDVVTDKAATIEKWHTWAPIVSETIPWTKLAFAVQDGMTPSDVPSNADVVFVGGSVEWKWKNLLMWTNNFQRVHVAKVNSERLLWMAHDAGAESVDGTGWMRGGEERWNELESYLKQCSNGGRKQELMPQLL